MLKTCVALLLVMIIMCNADITAHYCSTNNVSFFQRVTNAAGAGQLLRAYNFTNEDCIGGKPPAGNDIICLFGSRRHSPRCAGHQVFSPDNRGPGFLDSDQDNDHCVASITDANSIEWDIAVDYLCGNFSDFPDVFYTTCNINKVVTNYSSINYQYQFSASDCSNGIPEILIGDDLEDLEEICIQVSDRVNAVGYDRNWKVNDLNSILFPGYEWINVQTQVLQIARPSLQIFCDFDDNHRSLGYEYHVCKFSGNNYIENESHRAKLRQDTSNQYYYEWRSEDCTNSVPNKEDCLIMMQHFTPGYNNYNPKAIAENEIVDGVEGPAITWLSLNSSDINEVSFVYNYICPH